MTLNTFPTTTPDVLLIVEAMGRVAAFEHNLISITEIEPGLAGSQSSI